MHKLGQLIGINNQEDLVITYAKIIQYIALSYRYDHIVHRFRQLTDSLEKWYKHYETITNIREEYPSYKYKVSSNFLQPIPGESIYVKYKDFVNIP